ncbi:hypothetical protein HY417_02275 [Candidatus Kaiserbacteria bacterium]|nr:hypothetical protein [Candidatus Kaiserbacteria bacterium]
MSDPEKQQHGVRPKLNLKDPQQRKAVAHMLADGVPQKEIATHYGFKHQGSLALLLHREGGTDSFIETTLGDGAARKYREQISGRDGESKSRIAYEKHEGNLIADVAEDISLTPGRRLDELGTPEPAHSRHWPTGLHMQSSSGFIERRRKEMLRTCNRAVSLGKHKETVQTLMNSLATAISENKPVESHVPVVVSRYTRKSAASSVEEQKVLVLRVRRLTKGETDVSGDQSQMIDELIGALHREVNRAGKPDSAFGKALRVGGYGKVDLQTTMLGQPVTLCSADLS